MSRPRLGLSVVLGLVVALAAGCANIPEHSTPQAVRNGGAKAPDAVAPPDPDADPFELVRDFIGEAGNPDAAKAYLNDQGRRQWPGDAAPTIIDETFGAVPVSIQEQKAQGGDDGGNLVTVVLNVTKVGRLGLDRAFIPTHGTDEFRVEVRRDANKQWRIDRPPNQVLITLPDFTESYKAVSVYFFDPDLRVVVPDLRYIAATPAGGAPARVIQLLLSGPSDTLDGAVRTMLNEDTTTRTNVVLDPEGALVVNLTKLGDKTPAERQLIAAQVVLSLRDIAPGRIRLMVDGHALILERLDWRPTDIPSYDVLTKPSADGLYVADGRVHSLKDGKAIPGPAGAGDYQVRSAALSLDGRALAVVQETENGPRLRIGSPGAALPEVDLEAASLTRPTWRLGTTEAGSNEVWTVQNLTEVVRVLRTGDGSWDSSPVDASELAPYGPISDLRLSRDGVRLAVVANGQVVVASVARTKDSVKVRAPRALQGTEVTNVVGVDWLSQDTVVVATSKAGQLVVNIPVDGFEFKRYGDSNLSAPVTAIAAAPDREVVVTDREGMWTASEPGNVWRPNQQVPGARPFYAG